MKKLIMYFLTVLLVVSFAGCDETSDKETNEIISVTFDKSSLEASYEASDFKLSELQLIVLYEDDTSMFVPITEEMVGTVDLEKLNTSGKHTIEVLYEGTKTTVSIRILDIIPIQSELQRQLTKIYNEGIEHQTIEAMTYDQWLASINAPLDSEQKVLFQTQNGTVSWKYEGTDTWTTIIDVIVNGQGVTNTSVLVGNSVTTTGALAFVGLPYVTGIEAYFAMINANGGVNGRVIDFVNYDDQFDASSGLIYAEKLVEDDEIFAFVGHFGTPIVAATEPYLTSVGIPRVYYASGIDDLFNPSATGGDRASFPVQPLNQGEGQVMLTRAVDTFHAQKVGVIYSTDDTGIGMRQGIELEAGRRGVTTVSVQINYNDTDLTYAALEILEEDVDFIIIASHMFSASAAVKALDIAGSDIDCITSYTNASPSFIELIKDNLSTFDVYANTWIDFYNEDSSFTDEYNTYVHQMTSFGEDYSNNTYAMSGWIAAAFFVEGLDRVGTNDLTWENYINAMEESPIKNPFGGYVDFAGGLRVGTQAMGLSKATITPGTGGTQPLFTWETVKPIEPIGNMTSIN